MRHLSSTVCLFALAVCAASTSALAGPCSDDIATVGRQLSVSPAMGPVTSGTVSGAAPAGQAGQQAAPNTGMTSADKHIGGTAGTKELNAASSGVATSDADVRAQQSGHPTAAAQTQPGVAGSDDRMAQAKMAWQKAVDLNAQGDAGCKTPLDQAKADLANHS